MRVRDCPATVSRRPAASTSPITCRCAGYAVFGGLSASRMSARHSDYPAWVGLLHMRVRGRARVIVGRTPSEPIESVQYPDDRYSHVPGGKPSPHEATRRCQQGTSGVSRRTPTPHERRLRVAARRRGRRAGEAPGRPGDHNSRRRRIRKVDVQQRRLRCLVVVFVQPARWPRTNRRRPLC